MTATTVRGSSTGAVDREHTAESITNAGVGRDTKARPHCQILRRGGVWDDRGDVDASVQPRFPVDRRIAEHPRRVPIDSMDGERLVDEERRGLPVRGGLVGTFWRDADRREQIAAEPEEVEHPPVHRFDVGKREQSTPHTRLVREQEEPNRRLLSPDESLPHAGKEDNPGRIGEVRLVLDERPVAIEKQRLRRSLRARAPRVWRRIFHPRSLRYDRGTIQGRSRPGRPARQAPQGTRWARADRGVGPAEAGGSG